MNELLQCGRVVATHGIHGEIKVEPWCDDPAVFTRLERLYLDGAPLRLLRARPHKGHMLLLVEGVDTVEAAMALKGKIFSVQREDIDMPEGRYFVQDLIGLTAIDADTGAEIGKLADVLPTPAHDVYIIRGAREVMVPAVDEFVREIDMDGRTIRLHLIEGM